MIKTILATFLVIISPLVFSQAAAPIYSVCSLPATINESSGIEKTGPNTFWSHNDSGGQPAIYQFDSTGVLIKTLTFSNATNFDWEDIAEDHLKNIYVGDFGNNNNDRSVANNNRLRVYKIGDPNLITGTTTTASIINFEYVDRNFSAPAGNHNFDMEGFFFFNDSLHLFTKNRTNPTNGWIKHYILPSVPGTYTAMVVDSFNNGGTRITAADISFSKKTVALMANDKIWLFSCFKGSKFISTGTSTVLTVPFTQKEAIVFSGDSVIYITDEDTGGGSRKLYRANLAASLTPPVVLTVLSNNTVLCAGQAATISVSGASTYTWNSQVTGSFIVVSPSITTTYSVAGTATNSCKNTASFTQSVAICTAVLPSYFSGTEVQLFPDPFTNVFKIRMEGMIYKKAEIFNCLGKLLFTFDIGQDQFEVDMTDSAPGIYFVKLSSGNKFIIKKALKL